MGQYTALVVYTGLVTVHGQLVIVRVVACRVDELALVLSGIACRVIGDTENARLDVASNSSTTYLGDGVCLVSMDHRSGFWAVGDIGIDNLGHV